jgi:group I intron endonuclease
VIGIYRIYHAILGREYIGQSHDIETRWKQHISLLNSKNHHSRRLQIDWDKYDHECFLFEVIEEVLTIDKLTEREQYYLDERFPIYNVFHIASTPLRADTDISLIDPEIAFKKLLNPKVKTRKKVKAEREQAQMRIVVIKSLLQQNPLITNYAIGQQLGLAAIQVGRLRKRYNIL